MKITQAVTRAIEQNAESDWQLIYYLNNTHAHSGFIFDQYNILHPESIDNNMMITCHDVGAREAAHYHGVI